MKGIFGFSGLHGFRYALVGKSDSMVFRYNGLEWVAEVWVFGGLRYFGLGRLAGGFGGSEGSRILRVLQMCVDYFGVGVWFADFRVVLAHVSLDVGFMEFSGFAGIFVGSHGGLQRRVSLFSYCGFLGVTSFEWCKNSGSGI